MRLSKLPFSGKWRHVVLSARRKALEESATSALDKAVAKIRGQTGGNDVGKRENLLPYSKSKFFSSEIQTKPQ